MTTNNKIIRWGEPDYEALVRSTVAPGLTTDEFRLYKEVAISTGLNPLARQIHAVPRSSGGARHLTIQVGIDGLRLIALRTGEYQGQLGPLWCGKDGEWKDVWLDEAPPLAAKVGVLRAGFNEPVWGIATYQSYAQFFVDKSDHKRPQGLWGKMPDVMLAKCAEAAALRKAFPQELSGIYADDELMQADNPPPVIQETPVQTTRRSTQKIKKITPPDPDIIDAEVLIPNDLEPKEAETSRIVIDGEIIEDEGGLELVKAHLETLDNRSIAEELSRYGLSFVGKREDNIQKLLDILPKEEIGSEKVELSDEPFD
ncbi:MAG: phage recombination protein Bet [Candidatus Parvarchaeum sp.]